MQMARAVDVRDNVINKHFETIKSVQKSFIDNTDPDYPQCSEYAAFIAWASQYVVLCKDTQLLTKCQSGLATLNRDYESKKFKKETIESILNNFNKDGYVQFLQ